jgi:hypothetical protein
MMFKKNGHAFSLKYSPKVNTLFFWPTIQRGGCTPLPPPPPLQEEAYVPTSNGLRRIMNLSCSLLPSLIKRGKSPRGI